MSFILDCIVIIIFTSVLYVLYHKWRYQYWKKRNLAYVKPTIPFGSLSNTFKRRKMLGEILKDIYDEYKSKGAKHVGLFDLTVPVYLPIDLEFVKNVMAKDFSHFVDRGIYYNEKDDPISAHLFAIGGTKWRNLRVKMSPTFTSGKMKMMFSTLTDCSKFFKLLIDEKVKKGDPIDIKEELGRFTTDVIGSCAFGLDFNSIQEDNSPFRKHGKAIFERSMIQAISSRLAVNFPSIAHVLHYKSVPEDTSKFFMKLVSDTVTYREKNNVVRNDFMQILIDLKNKKLDHEIEEKHDGRALTTEEVAAQCFVFFLAGFETSSTTMTFALLELCKNQVIQNKVRDEMNTVLKKYNNEITYEAVMEMKYLSQVIDEALRMYPPVPILTRNCVENYKVPNTNVTFDTSVRCMIPVFAIHRDEEHYPSPEVFDPERFSDENKKQRHPYAFIPFGEGPRICIGMRFGYLQSKVGLCVLLKNYKFTLHPKTIIPIKFQPYSFISSVEGGVWLVGKPV